MASGQGALQNSYGVIGTDRVRRPVCDFRQLRRQPVLLGSPIRLVVPQGRRGRK